MVWISALLTEMTQSFTISFLTVQQMNQQKIINVFMFFSSIFALWRLVFIAYDCAIHKLVMVVLLSGGNRVRRVGKFVEKSWRNFQCKREKDMSHKRKKKRFPVFLLLRSILKYF